MRDISEFFQNESDCPELDIQGVARRLSAAIQCPTVNDRQSYEAFDKLQALMRRSYPAVMAAGSFETVGHSVLITLPGGDGALRPVLFMAHQDVVPIVRGTEKDWSYPPFSGAIAEGYIWGRGALDIKQQVFGTLEAAEYLLSRGLRPRRTVYLAFGEDEETFNTGSRAIAALLAQRGAEPEFLLDEGGGRVESGRDMGAPDIFVSRIDLAEKGYADLELSVESRGGHSSRPFGGTSLGILAEAIARITQAPFPPVLPPAIRESFAALAPYITQEPLRALVERMDTEPEALAEYCLGSEALFPLVTTTVAPTMIKGGSDACNVMPQNMSAVINFRLAIGYTADRLMEHCRAAVNDSRVKLRFLQANDPSLTAGTDSQGYALLARSLGRYYRDVVFIPSLSVGATDARSYEGICGACLRCSPFMADEEDLRRGVHGTDERISLRSYAQGIRVLIGLMEEACF